MLPVEFAEKMERLLGAEEWDALLAAWERPRAVGLRLQAGMAARLAPDGDAAARLPADWALAPVPWAAGGYFYDPAARPGLHPWHEAGLYYLQEPSAMAPAALLAPRPGMRVLDLCAAPGGKSTQLLSALGGRGLLVSNELHPGRAKILSQNLERVGAANALVLNEHPARLAERLPRFFDAVLVDAPCSGEGMFRKEAAAVADWTPDTPRICARRQREILESAAATVRAGGRLLYSTCTFSPEENEGVVSDFLRDHPEFSLVQPDAPWFAPGRPDLLTDPVPGLEACCRLWPHRLRGEGHFAALLQYNGLEASDLPEEPGVPLPQEARALLDRLGAALPERRCLDFGGRLFLLPPDCPSLRGLRTLRPGLCLGTAKKGRFEPDHALSHALPGLPAVDYPSGAPEVAASLRGETLPAGDAAGWLTITAEGLALGWAKSAGGVLKNHYPKGLRRLT